MKIRLSLLMVALLAFACDNETSPAASAPSVAPETTLEEAVAPLGKPMLPAYKTLGDLRPAKADQYDDYRNSHPELYAITMPPSVAVRPVAEYEDGGRLLITLSSWGVPAGIRKNWVDIVKYGKDVVDITVIHDGAAIKSNFTSALQSAGVSANAVTWVNMDLDSIWTRDYGPTPITSLTGKVGMVDNRYYHQRIYDDAIPTKLGSLWNTSVFRSPLDFEGGNFMSDTQGNCFCSEGVLWYNGVGESDIKAYFKDYYGCNTLYIMKTLANEGTTHIDMQMKLTSDKTVIVGEYGASQDPQNYQITNQNAAFFEGLGLTVYRMPMPSNSDGAFRTFINSLFINGVNMVPVYSIDKAKEAQALAIWEQVMPTWQHVPMNADDVIQWAGAIHCITMTTIDGSFSKMQADPEYACGGDWDCYPGNTGGGCDGISYEGCCDGSLLKYCDNNQLQTINCGSNPQCGWNAQGKFYDCNTNGGSDPSGTNPKSCDGGCTPDCAGKACGGDGCGGSCGSCSGTDQCQGGQCVPVGDGCNGLTYEGCCDGNTLKYCEDNQLKSLDCAGNPSCGWNADAKFYDCGTAGAADPSNSFPLSCQGDCQPNCTGKECGDDGCGGSCGACAGSQTCQAWKCVGTCTPACAGKVCGDDGCGGSCGSCAAGKVCQAGQCNTVDDPCLGISWEGCCESSTLHWCENDTVQSLECADAGCGWNGASSYYDCNQSGADPSGANPLECPGTECIPNCADKTCGDNGCGGSCGTCGAGQTCQAGICVGGGGCGDVTYAGYCQGEVLTWCENDKVNTADCSKLNGNYKCLYWEEGGGYYCMEQDVCTPSCTNKDCGDDGCGGSCGTCADGESCKAGKCQAGPCEPNCTNKDCGDDGCGGSCGSCAAGEKCQNGACIAPCAPDCAGFECGGDGCGGSCGVCPAGFSCKQHACVQGCEPDCTGKECGDDGCGGFCGSCPGGESCQDGQCTPVCAPACGGKECGPDGCGGTCGSCPKDYTCDAGDCVIAPDGCGNITSVGQCEGDILKKCVSSQVIDIDCAATGKVCSFVPNAGVFDCVENCIPNCAGKVCGSDGCGGTCGACLKGETCDAGQCLPAETPCTPNCAGLECGDDGCGGTCGICTDGKDCLAGACKVAEVPIEVDVIAADTTPEADAGDGDSPKVKGGGGCNSSAAPTAGSALLFLLVAGLAVLRRSAMVSR